MKRNQKPPTPLTPELRARYQQEFLDELSRFSADKERKRREAERVSDQPVLAGAGDAGAVVVARSVVVEQ